MSDDGVRLKHLLDAAKKAVSLTRGKERKDLDEDEVLSLALARLLEIVGEAAKHVSEATKQAHPDMPWRAMAGTRDRLIHGYFDVDLDIIWTIITEDLPLLIAKLERS